MNITAEELRELQDRGRFFSQGFPGAAASEEWTRFRDAAEQEHTDTAEPPAHASEPAATIRTGPGTP